MTKSRGHHRPTCPDVLIVHAKTSNLRDNAIDEVNIAAGLDISNVFGNPIVRSIGPIVTDVVRNFTVIRRAKPGGLLSMSGDLESRLAETGTLGCSQEWACLERLVGTAKVEDVSAIAILVEGNVVGVVVHLDASDNRAVSKARLAGVTLAMEQGRDINSFDAVVLDSQVGQDIGQRVCVVLIGQATSREALR